MADLNQGASIEAERAKDEADALDDLRKAVLEGAADEWLLGFVRGYPFNSRTPLPIAAAGEEELPTLPKEAANIWYHRGLPNFDDTDNLKALDDSTGKAIPLYTAEQYQQGQREAIAADRRQHALYQRKQAGLVGAAPRDYFAWWTSIETDVRRSMLVFAHREPERLHALVRQAYEAGQQSIMKSGQEGDQPTKERGE
jgi:hypothetical protein